MPLLLLGLLALLALGLLLLPPWWRRQQRQRRMQAPFPAAWRSLLRREWPLYRRLTPPQQRRLQQLVQVFVAEKPVIGCGGLKVSTAMKVLIAAQACLPLLGHARGVYPQLSQVLLYPAAFAVQRVHDLGAGVQMERREWLSGESWQQGQVILSWQDVLAGARVADDGRNVVIHEFAHQLDQANGRANGAPPLGSRQAHEHWATVMQGEFQALKQALAQGLPCLLDPYAATDEAEFFAVASESFFEQGELMAQRHPRLYALLADYYGLQPRHWQTGATS
ncbi:zinc-dependent peptidase [Mitsuaria sp. WAJ17]|uniref:M90 family metallopeptidase n=1 Tax=Mitsuaria sp. WAJ17 TaxID=2761452 RepID=UPI0015FFA170|nr:M90 family metallopeptidase [Mitsuaria sp. WAJ17]MBB2484960.1 zinc-dependent peptidase [Mitsuaria sp. WAJ17]